MQAPWQDPRSFQREIPTSVPLLADNTMVSNRCSWLAWGTLCRLLPLESKRGNNQSEYDHVKRRRRAFSITLGSPLTLPVRRMQWTMKLRVPHELKVNDGDEEQR